ncbi:hypothetical protein GCM10010439_20660 [Actinocorallia aurantiaca]|uniref:DUF397 domain-containing protein n=1 Tax=Actinocorallia aurantiaca TaxID=46204 RepID=A0ABP6GLI2_9ACTN
MLVFMRFHSLDGPATAALSAEQAPSSGGLDGADAGAPLLVKEAGSVSDRRHSLIRPRTTGWVVFVR